MVTNILSVNPPEQVNREATSYNIVEESRRIDAAMPSTVQINKPTEVWIQICLSDKPGFRNKLPAPTHQGDLITQDDVYSDELPVGFPVDHNGQLRSVPTILELVTPDFDIQEHKQYTSLSPIFNGGKLVFSIVPKIVREHTSIHIKIKMQSADKEYWYVLDTITLSTCIKRQEHEDTKKIAWTLLSKSLLSSAGKSISNHINRITESLLFTGKTKKSRKDTSLHSDKTIDLTRFSLLAPCETLLPFAVYLFDHLNVPSLDTFIEVQRWFNQTGLVRAINFVPISAIELLMCGDVEQIIEYELLVDSYWCLYQRLNSRLTDQLDIRQRKANYLLLDLDIKLPGIAFFSSFNCFDNYYLYTPTPDLSQIAKLFDQLNNGNSSKLKLPRVSLKNILHPVFGKVEFIEE